MPSDHPCLTQMIQFVAALVMGLNAIRIGCDFPMWMQVKSCQSLVCSKRSFCGLWCANTNPFAQYSCIAYMVSFLVLFSDFYYKVD